MAIHLQTQSNTGGDVSHQREIAYPGFWIPPRPLGPGIRVFAGQINLALLKTQGLEKGRAKGIGQRDILNPYKTPAFVDSAPPHGGVVYPCGVVDAVIRSPILTDCR